jgi:hypothetical protein
MKTVIGFDNWTKGSIHYERLIPSLKLRGYRLILIHIGEWGHDKNRPNEEYIGNLLVRGIDYYNGISLKEILILENPSAVIFLSTRVFANQALNRYCRNLNIPTLHLYHGLVSVGLLKNKEGYKINWKNQWKRIKSNLPKNIFLIWPLYWRALIDTRASFIHVYWFFKELYHRLLNNTGIAPPDATTTAGCVYTKKDISDMIKIYRMPSKKVHAVGNPDIINFDLKDNDIGSGTDLLRESNNLLLYIDNGLAMAGFSFNDTEDYVDHLVSTREAVEKQGYRFVIKLKPSQLNTNLHFRLKELDIEICLNDKFVDYLKLASAAIVEASTAAMIPAIMGLPLLLAKYGKLSTQEYGMVLTEYPRAIFLQNIHNISFLLEEEQKNVKFDEVNDWIDENVGPLPANMMPERVASVVEKIINDNKNNT